MSILEKLQVVDRQHQRPSDFSEPVSLVTLNVAETGNMVSAGLATTFEFALTAKLEIRFGANKAQYNEALKNAQKQMLIALYGDILPHVYACKSAIFAGDAAQALTMLGRIEKEIGL